MGRKYSQGAKGITLRLEAGILRLYHEIAFRANHRRVLHGDAGNLTAQDVMRHRLASLPVAKLRSKRGGV